MGVVNFSEASDTITDASRAITVCSGRMNIAVVYHPMNQKFDTGKTLKRWAVVVDHYSTTP